MTDRELAEEYAKDYFRLYSPQDEELRAVIQAYLAGLKAGKPKWHKVADGDLPTHSYKVLVFTDEGVGFGIYGLDDKKWHTYDTGFDVIAWCEIPTFDKE